MKKILIVVANYYKEISSSLLNSAEGTISSKYLTVVKKVVGLDGYGIKITKQEIIKWKKY